MGAGLIVAAFASAALVLVPSPWFWKTRNISMWFLTVWLSAVNLIYGINAVIWEGNTRAVNLIWCDVATKLIVGASYGIPACCLCTSIHLERLSSFRHIRPTLYRTRSRAVFDVLMCWGVPAIFMALHFVVQGHRFDIYEDMGCYPTWFWSIPGIIINSVAPLLMVITSLICLGLALRNLSRHQAMTVKYFSKRAPILSSTRFFRLLVLVFVQLILCVLLVLATLSWLALRNGTVEGYISWAATHVQFSRVWMFSRASQTVKELRWQTVMRCLISVSGLCVFVFFFNAEVMGEYRLMYSRCLERLRWCCCATRRERPSSRPMSQFVKNLGPDHVPRLPENVHLSTRITTHPVLTQLSLNLPGAQLHHDISDDLSVHFRSPSPPVSIYTIDIHVDPIASGSMSSKLSAGRFSWNPFNRPSIKLGGRIKKVTSAARHNSTGSSTSLYSNGTGDDSGYAGGAEESASAFRNPSPPNSTENNVLDSNGNVLRRIHAARDSGPESDDIVAEQERQFIENTLSAGNDPLLWEQTSSTKAVLGDSPPVAASVDPPSPLRNPLRPPSSYTVDVQLPESFRRSRFSKA